MMYQTRYLGAGFSAFLLIIFLAHIGAAYASIRSGIVALFAGIFALLFVVALGSMIAVRAKKPNVDMGGILRAILPTLTIAIVIWVAIGLGVWSAIYGNMDVAATLQNFFNRLIMFAAYGLTGLLALWIAKLWLSAKFAPKAEKK